LYTQTWLAVHVHHHLTIEDAHPHRQGELDLVLPDAVLHHLEDIVLLRLEDAVRLHPEGAMTTTTTAAKETEAVPTRDTADAIHPTDIKDNKEQQTLMALPFVQKKVIPICKYTQRSLSLGKTPTYSFFC